MIDTSEKTSVLAKVIVVRDDIVTFELQEEGERHGIMKNEVVFIRPSSNPAERLQAEVLRIRGREADAQVFEDTRGIAIGDAVELSSQLLSVALGPGLLSQVYDGLQNPLENLAVLHGFFLPRGTAVDGLDPNKRWKFTPTAKIGDVLRAGDVLGSVQEDRFTHKIFVPFDMVGEVTVDWVQVGNFTVNDPIARVVESDGRERTLTMTMHWPVRRPIPAALLRRRSSMRLYPEEPMVTSLRLVDTFFPVARGGTACIPGPFGAGKTILQHLISRYSAVDVVIVIACGERAGEVVETITEFPNLIDPHTGGSLMDRTIIICNTSSMPVAAREASIYTGVTLGEYYRQMGFHVLIIADSTSRWAQAMRETSGRLEEIPGEEAFPAYLDSSVRGIYERAGVIRTNDGSVGSLTMIGTVSPAGGNFEEPVTQSTMRTVKTFLGLSSERAYKRFYPAVDPSLSWSRYREQLRDWFDREMDPDWTQRVERMLRLLQRGNEVAHMMQVTGEEGISLEDYLDYQRATFVDMVYLQQDAFDDVDASSSLARQKVTFAMVAEVVAHEPNLADKDAVRKLFTRLTGLFKNFNYAAETSPDFKRYRAEIKALLGG
ncbi:V-type ATP synthase alpha chain [Sulfidibacter corallicola]|uniref:V-type ATP synthase alpha chain n=1 Tax=Sulfidibacter corallicola TaxID=2818388 RepID=A0A8A4TJQ4_SULCO|nr:V-type ATP synthase subunit A [Sulfidibacter corallicola]QTD49382.1 V-type ATP synthase subunit A [Sulfidibacter corallicola]